LVLAVQEMHQLQIMVEIQLLLVKLLLVVVVLVIMIQHQHVSDLPEDQVEVDGILVQVLVEQAHQDKDILVHLDLVVQIMVVVAEVLVVQDREDMVDLGPLMFMRMDQQIQ
jgi:hypothetical protein